MMWAVRAFILLALVSMARSAFAEGANASAPPSAPPPPSNPASHASLRRWALLASSDLRQSGISDLVTAELQRISGVQWVERERFDAVSAELSRTALSTGGRPTDRLRLGSLLGADALLLVSTELPSAATSQPAGPSRGPALVRVLIAECGHGVRLSVQQFPNDRNLPAAIAGLVRKIQFHFPDGVRYAVAVPHFISRDLGYEFNYLQSGFADLVESGLDVAPGVAVIETEEAGALSREAEIAGGKPPGPGATGCIVPRLIRGEYEMVAIGQGGAGAAGPNGRPVANERSVTLSVDVLDGKKSVFHVRRTLTLLQAAAYLSSELPHQVLLGIAPNDPALSSERQFSLLTERAGEFARVGQWDHSSGLREAALLLKPDAAEQVRLLIEEHRSQTWLYMQSMQSIDGFNPNYVPPASAMWYQNHKAELDAWYGRELAFYVETLGHLEAVIRHGTLTRYELLNFAWQVRFMPQQDANQLSSTFDGPELAQFEARLDSFLDDTFPLVLRLKPGNPPDSIEIPLSDRWAGQRFLLATYRKNDRFTKGDLDRFLRYGNDPLCKPMGPPVALLQFLFDHRAGTATGIESFKTADYLSFLKSMSESPVPSTALCGEYGLLWRDCFTHAQPVEQLQKRCVELGLKLRPLFGSLVDYYDEIHLEIEKLDVAAGLDEPKYIRSSGFIPAPKPSPSKALRNTLNGPGRLDWDEVALRILEKSGRTVSMKDKKWDPSSPYPSNIMHLCPCGDGIDAIWGTRALMLHTADDHDLLREVYLDPEGDVQNVAWDGHDIWLADSKKGLILLSGKGAPVATIGADQGLPACDRRIRIVALSPGRIFATGSFGSPIRVWYAVVDRHSSDTARTSASQEATVRVNVFHKATHVLKDSRYNEDDPEAAVEPQWAQLVPNASKPSGNVVWVDRDSRVAMLQVNPDDLSVSLLDDHAEKFATPWHGTFFPLPDRTFLSNAGMIYQISMQKPFNTGHRFRLICGSQQPMVRLSDQFISYHGLVYVPGPEWYVIDPRTFRVERLGTGVAIDGWLNDSAIAYGTLSGYGLAGLYHGTLYHFFTHSPVKAAATEPIASASPTVRPAEFESRVGPLPNYPGFGFEVTSGLAKLWVTGTDEGTHYPNFQTADPVGTLRPAVEWLGRYPDEPARIGLSAGDWDQIEKTTQRFATWNSPEARIQCMTLLLAWHNTPAGPAQDECATKALQAVRDVGEQAWKARIQEEQALSTILTPNRLRILHYQVPVEEPQ